MRNKGIVPREKQRFALWEKRMKKFSLKNEIERKKINQNSLLAFWEKIWKILSVRNENERKE